MHASPVIRLRTQELRELVEREGIPSDAALARRLGLQQSTVMRFLEGEIRPGEKTIAAVLAAFPGSTFDALFEVVSDGTAA